MKILKLRLLIATVALLAFASGSFMDAAKRKILNPSPKDSFKIAIGNIEKKKISDPAKKISLIQKQINLFPSVPATDKDAAIKAIFQADPDVLKAFLLNQGPQDKTNAFQTEIAALKDPDISAVIAYDGTSFSPTAAYDNGANLKVKMTAAEIETLLLPKLQDIAQARIEEALKAAKGKKKTPNVNSIMAIFDWKTKTTKKPELLDFTTHANKYSVKLNQATLDNLAATAEKLAKGVIKTKTGTVDNLITELKADDFHNLNNFVERAGKEILFAKGFANIDDQAVKLDTIKKELRRIAAKRINAQLDAATATDGSKQSDLEAIFKNEVIKKDLTTTKFVVKGGEYEVAFKATDAEWKDFQNKLTDFDNLKKLVALKKDIKDYVKLVADKLIAAQKNILDGKIDALNIEPADTHHDKYKKLIERIYSTVMILGKAVLLDGKQNPAIAADIDGLDKKELNQTEVFIDKTILNGDHSDIDKGKDMCNNFLITTQLARAAAYVVAIEKIKAEAEKIAATKDKTKPEFDAYTKMLTEVDAFGKDAAAKAIVTAIIDKDTVPTILAELLPDGKPLEGKTEDEVSVIVEYIAAEYGTISGQGGNKGLVALANDIPAAGGGGDGGGTLSQEIIDWLASNPKISFKNGMKTETYDIKGTTIEEIKASIKIALDKFKTTTVWKNANGNAVEEGALLNALLNKTKVPNDCR